MKIRFFLVVSVLLFAVSCSQFVNLGDKSADGADNTEGLPDEIYEDNGEAGADYGDCSDWNEDSADPGYYDDGEKYSDNESAEDIDDTDMTDNMDPSEQSDSDWPSEIPDENSSYTFPESNPFPEEFSNADCDCGEDPQYDPICCNGVISVFNLCFAHCYAIHSANKICSVYKAGLCDGYESSDDDEEIPENDPEESDPETNDQDSAIVEENDNDEEFPDSDEESLESGCGCYPENEAAIFRCGEHSYFITSCLANCLCAEPEKIF